MRELIDQIVANPRDRTPQLVYADWLEETGSTQFARHIRIHGLLWLFGGYGGDGDGDGGGGDGGGGGGDGDGGYGYGYGDDGDGDGGVSHPSKTELSQGFTMEDGNLYIITTPSGWNPWVMIGWAKRDDIWMLMHNVRVIRYYGSRAQLSVIARKGPQRDTQLLEASPMEPIPITSITRPIPCDPKAWAKECPKPEGWE